MSPDHTLASAEISALYAAYGRDGLAWLLMPAPSGNGLIARPHTLSPIGGEVLAGHVAADGADALHAAIHELRQVDLVPGPGLPPDCLGLAW